jgi:hypothetical protein
MRALGPGAVVAPGAVVVAHLHRSAHMDVYDAWCERRACRVIVKTPRPDRRRDRRIVRALLAEGRLLRRLAHPAIVRGYEVHAGPRPAVVMETLGGETLDHLIRRRERRRVAAAEVAVVAIQLGGALRYLHAAGVLHLDVKPANVIAEAGRATLVDVSSRARPGGWRPASGRGAAWRPSRRMAGTSAPRPTCGGSARSCTSLATGAHPFPHDDGRELPQLERCAAPVGATRRPPPALAVAIDGCLAPDPAARPAFDDLLAVAAATQRGAYR